VRGTKVPRPRPIARPGYSHTPAPPAPRAAVEGQGRLLRQRRRGLRPPIRVPRQPGRARGEWHSPMHSFNGPARCDIAGDREDRTLTDEEVKARPAVPPRRETPRPNQLAGTCHPFVNQATAAAGLKTSCPNGDRRTLRPRSHSQKQRSSTGPGTRRRVGSRRYVLRWLGSASPRSLRGAPHRGP
jgi:hypothetical protein